MEIQGDLFLFFNNLGTKRGISSIVGGMIFLFLLTSGISVFFLAIQSQTTMMETQEVVMSLQTKKIQENYDISISTDSDNNNRLFIHAKNQGSFPLEISDFWIVNKTDSTNDFPAKRYSVNYTDSFIPPGHGANILENYPLYMIPDTYDVKVISTLGTIHKQEIDVGGSNNLRAELLTIPPDVRIGENVTIALHVTNIGKTKLLNVTAPQLDITPSSAVTLPLPPNPNPVNLNPSESVFFGWEYTTSGTPGNVVTFLGNATGIEYGTGFNLTSNNAIEEITLRENEGGDLIVLTQDLLSRPEIFLITPSPMGNAPERALWGANIVNPTGQEMYVSKVAISLVSPRANSQDVMFDSQGGSDGCLIQTVSPTRDQWDCPAANQLVWKDISTPERIAPYSVTPFLAKVHPGKLGGSDLLETVIVHGHVFTTVGEFGKSGYGTSFDDRNSDTSMVNVYLSDVIDSTDSDDIYVNKTGIPSASQQTFNVVLADFERGTSNEIDAGSRLIINIPKNWTLDTGSINGFGDFTTSWQIFSDDSSQIIGTLNNPLDGSGTVGLEGKS